MDARASVKVTEWASIISENLVKKQLKAFMKIFDSDVQKAFQRGSMFTKRFEDSSANVRSRFNAYCKAYEKQMKKISRSAAGISTTTTDKDQNKLETELFLMEVAYGVRVQYENFKRLSHFNTNFVQTPTLERRYRTEILESSRFRDQYLEEMGKIFDVIKVLEQRRAKVVKDVDEFLQNVRTRFGSALYPVSESLLAGVASIGPSRNQITYNGC